MRLSLYECRLAQGIVVVQGTSEMVFTFYENMSLYTQYSKIGAR